MHGVYYFGQMQQIKLILILKEVEVIQQVTFQWHISQQTIPLHYSLMIVLNIIHQDAHQDFIS